MTMKRSSTVISALLTTGLIAAASGCSGGAKQADSRQRPLSHVTTPSGAPKHVSRVDAYPGALDPYGAIGLSPRGGLIFEATVVEYRDATSVTPQHVQGSPPPLVYHPVLVQLDRVWRGPTISPGQTLLLRAIGGTYGTDTTEYADAFPPEAFKVGAKILVMSQPLVDIGDGVATTPNAVLGIDGDAVHMYNQESSQTYSLGDLRAAIQRRWGSP